jgi:prophage antirepressor-like protein
MQTVHYKCAWSSRKIEGTIDDRAAWFEFRQVAYLFGMKLERAAKLLRHAGVTGDIEPAEDIRSSDRCTCILSHRAVVAIGYQVNFGRATAFRHWCAADLNTRF